MFLARELRAIPGPGRGHLPGRRGPAHAGGRGSPRAHRAGGGDDVAGAARSRGGRARSCAQRAACGRARGRGAHLRRARRAPAVPRADGAAARARRAPAAITAGALPRGVREAIRQRRRRACPPAARPLLDLAAVIGDELEPGLLAQPSGLQRGAVAAALDAAVRAGLLVRARRAAAALLPRARARGALPRAAAERRRRRLHGRGGRGARGALQRRRPTPPLAELAHHAIEGLPPGRRRPRARGGVRACGPPGGRWGCWPTRRRSRCWCGRRRRSRRRGARRRCGRPCCWRWARPASAGRAAGGQGRLLSRGRGACARPAGRRRAARPRGPDPTARSSPSRSSIRCWSGCSRRRWRRCPGGQRAPRAAAGAPGGGDAAGAWSRPSPCAWRTRRSRRRGGWAIRRRCWGRCSRGCRRSCTGRPARAAGAESRGRALATCWARSRAPAAHARAAGDRSPRARRVWRVRRVASTRSRRWRAELRAPWYRWRAPLFRSMQAHVARPLRRGRGAAGGGAAHRHGRPHDAQVERCLLHPPRRAPARGEQPRGDAGLRSGRRGRARAIGERGAWQAASIGAALARTRGRREDTAPPRAHPEASCPPGDIVYATSFLCEPAALRGDAGAAREAARGPAAQRGPRRDAGGACAARGRGRWRGCWRCWPCGSAAGTRRARASRRRSRASSGSRPCRYLARTRYEYGRALAEPRVGARRTRRRRAALIAAPWPSARRGHDGPHGAGRAAARGAGRGARAGTPSLAMAECRGGAEPAAAARAAAPDCPSRWPPRASTGRITFEGRDLPPQGRPGAALPRAAGRRAGPRGARAGAGGGVRRGEDQPLDSGDAGELLDEEARERVRAASRGSARGAGRGRVASATRPARLRAREEIEFLGAELGRAVGLGGAVRRAGQRASAPAAPSSGGSRTRSGASRSRRRRWRITSARDSTGTFCVFRPGSTLRGARSFRPQAGR